MITLNDYLMSVNAEYPQYHDVTVCGQMRHFATGETIVKVEIAGSRFRKLAEIVSDYHVAEEVRAKNDTVNKAYEHYQLLLKLAQ